MNRILLALALLTVCALPAFAEQDRTSVIDDVIRMSKAGVDDDAIIKFVRESHDLYVVDADVIIALSDAKVSKPVLEAVMDEAYDRGDRNRRSDDRDDRRTRTVYVRPYVGSYYGAYSPWSYGPYYDPFWYGPRISIGFGFGGYRGGYYRGGHWGGGHRGRGRH